MINNFQIKEKKSYLIISSLSILLLSALGCCSVSAAVIGNIDKISILIENEGTIGSKSMELSDSRNEPLNNHGFFYNCLSLEFSYLNSVGLKTHLRLLNDELSALDNYSFFFEPEFTLNLKINNLKTTFRGGYINDLTLGNGLTVKDLSNSGGIIGAQWNGWSCGAGIFARGYSYNEDLIWANLQQPFIPIELIVLCINTQGTKTSNFYQSNKHISGYLLPNFQFKFPWGIFYAEYGLKLDYRRNVEGLIEECKKYTNAGMIGFKADNSWKRISFNGCVEIRAYEKGFIPLTGIDEGFRFERFWKEQDSRANWVDFYDSRETSLWAYLQINMDFRFFRELYLFFNDELLYFHSNQKEAAAFSYSNYSPKGAIVKYYPSTHFYRTGIRYKFFRNVSVEFALSNKLLNIRGINKSFYSQWGQRFIATKYPYCEARLRWQF